MLGDGIGHVLATSTGQVWVGYFDEGIYGNYGWGRTDSEEPVGAYGIVRFSPDLEPDWHYPKYTGVGPWDAISDCYALNVDDTSAWACYDSDFPIVRIRDGAVTGWHNDIKGASALAVAGICVALFGGYGPDYDRLALAELGAERVGDRGGRRTMGRRVLDVRPLRVPAYARLWAAGWASAAGSQLTAVVVPLEIYGFSGSSAYVGLASLTGLVPMVVAALWGGALANTVDRRRMLLVTSAGIGVTSILLWAQAAAGLKSVAALLLIAVQ